MNLEQTLANLLDKLTGWIESFILLLPNLVVALLIVVAAWIAAKVLRKVVRRVMDRVSSYHQVNNLLATVAYVLALAVGTFVALGVLDLDKTVTSLLAGAGIIGLALGFAFQDIAANFISGILLSVRRPFQEGDFIETNGFNGIVEEINLRTTLVRTFQGQIVLIPNAQVFQNPLTNYSRTGSRRVDLSCGVAYGDDLEHARTVSVDAIKELDFVDASKPVNFFYNEFGGSSINFILNFWIDFEKQPDFLHAQSEAIIQLKKALDDGGLTIPFPIQTLDFGVVGGVNLNEVLPQHLYQQDGASGTPAGS